MVRSYRVKVPFVDGIFLFIFFLSEFRRDPWHNLPRFIFVPKFERDRFGYLQLIRFVQKYQDGLAALMRTSHRRAPEFR